ncbi:MAG: hypothetical protein L6R35_003614 [Caloplaca aegaea]|nr:MAG: hypothetical protein L6R35_003614 [Caloplaca aegaea]
MPWRRPLRLTTSTRHAIVKLLGVIPAAQSPPWALHLTRSWSPTSPRSPRLVHHLMVLLAPQRLLEDLLALARGGPNITSQHILRSCLCKRRQWPQPHFESYYTSGGYACVARVNNREYQTDTTYGSDLLARENAAMRAYLICRNFSVNDGMYPSGHAKGPVIQGLPVAIGTERRSVYTDELDNGSRSGGSSPNSYGSVSSYGDSRRDSRRISGTGRALRYEPRRY